MQTSTYRLFILYYSSYTKLESLWSLISPYQRNWLLWTCKSARNVAAAWYYCCCIWVLNALANILDVSKLKFFLGLCNIYWPAVQISAWMASPLKKKPKNGEPRNILHCYAGGSGLKNKMESTAVLVLSRRKGHIALDMDACNKQIRRAWCNNYQTRQENNLDPGRGRWLRQRELQYNTWRVLDCILGCSVISLMFGGQKLIILMVQEAWKWIIHLADSIDKLVFWRLRLLEFQFDVIHGAGIKNQAADGLFWLGTGVTGTTELNDNLPYLIVSSVGQGAEDVNDDRDAKLVLMFWVCQQFHDTLKMVFGIQLDLSATSHTNTTHTETGKLQRWKHFCKHSLQILNAKPPPRQLGSRPRYLLTAAMLSWYHSH